MRTPRWSTSGHSIDLRVWRSDIGRGPLDLDRASDRPGGWIGTLHATPSRPRRSVSGSLLFHWLIFAGIAWILLIYTLR